jgi:Flp pilus assembly protein protease CpaA
MLSPLLFQIPIFLFLIAGAYQDYKTRTVSNKIILCIAILSLPLILQQTSFLIPVLLCILFLGLFYMPEKIGNIDTTLVANSMGGADTKVLIVLILGMSTNSIFIFFLLFTIPNIYYLIRFCKGIPLFIPILFGYFGVLGLSFLPIVIRMVFGE